jgi:hypothetical protein
VQNPTSSSDPNCDERIHVCLSKPWPLSANQQLPNQRTETFGAEELTSAQVAILKSRQPTDSKPCAAPRYAPSTNGRKRTRKIGELKTTVAAEVAQEIGSDKSGLRSGRLWRVLAGACFCHPMAHLRSKNSRPNNTIRWPAVRVAGPNREILTAHPTAMRRFDKSRIRCECEIKRSEFASATAFAYQTKLRCAPA